jgi:uncharacterized protein with PIN domain
VKFTAGPPLGKLAKWLRILGFDCRYAIEESQMSGDAKDRLLLTRRANMTGRGIIYIGVDRVEDQLRVLSQLLPLGGNIHPFSRCIECNTPTEPVAKEDIISEIPEYIALTHDSFTICPRCNKVFWSGTHRSRMEEKIAHIFG